MQPHDDGESDANRTRVIYCSADPDPAILETIDAEYRVTTVGSPTAATEHVDATTDCLLVDGDLFHELRSACPDPSTGGAVPIIALVDTPDRELVRAVTRRPEFDLVYHTGDADTGDAGPEAVSERLCGRINATCRDVDPDLAEPILEVAGLLMSATPDEVDTRIEWGLRSVAERLGADRCVLYDCADGSLSATHSWTASGSLTHESVSADTFPGFESTLERFEPVVFDAEPAAAADLGYRGAFFASPVVIDWNLEHVLVFGGFPAGRITDTAVARLGTFGDLVGHTLKRDRRLREIERQNERLERFASVIRHDLQNPLNVISGFADIAKESGDPADIDRILSAASRMESILEDLHVLVDEADDLGEREPTSVADLVDRARTSVDMRDATVETDDIGIVETDPGRLRQAFENLFRNAVEHAGPDVTVRVSSLPDGFAIDDDGPGIPPADRDRVFDEGYTDGGTGLGLSIVRTVVDAHGWEIEVTDAPDGGARFEITGVEFVDRGVSTSTVVR